MTLMPATNTPPVRKDFQSTALVLIMVLCQRAPLASTLLRWTTGGGEEGDGEKGETSTQHSQDAGDSDSSKDEKGEDGESDCVVEGDISSDEASDKGDGGAGSSDDRSPAAPETKESEPNSNSK